MYNGRFFPNGYSYFCSSQEEIKIYDVSDLGHWHCTNSFTGRGVRWTITDLDLSPDQNYLIYTSVGPILNLIRLNEEPSSGFSFTAEQDSITLDDSSMEYGVFSCRFSGSGTEVLVGTRTRTVEIHDLITKQRIYRVLGAHSDDINTACFDSEGSQVMYSGSDDTTIKIWDRRIKGRTPQGILLGHREGITNICSKGNGFHLISNGKDQCIKLWDIRLFKNAEEHQEYVNEHNYSMGFDYRFGDYPLQNYTKKLAIDSSLMTFRGHKVVSTLIRCYFSPMESTGQRYVYTGSGDGTVVVYDTYTGKLAARLRPGEDLDHGEEDVCRDVSWHPFMPVIAATSFHSTVHQYNFC